MPRVRRNDTEPIKLTSKDTEEDYLDVDKPLPGQNYYCISFVSPEKVLEQKELFMYYHYERAFYKKLTDIMENSLTELIAKSDDGKIDIYDVIKIKKSVSNAYNEENVNFDKFKSKLEDFRFRDEDKIGEIFDKQNNFNTSIRGVKVRGVFDTKREADIRSSVLQRMDPLFDVFVGQVGFWCPWDPNPHKINDIEYMNNDLNKLVKEYKTNETKKDHFYQEQKSQRQKDAISSEDRLKHQAGLNDMREYQQKEKDKHAQSQITKEQSENTLKDHEQSNNLNSTENNMNNINNMDSMDNIINMNPNFINLEKLANITEEECENCVSGKCVIEKCSTSTRSISVCETENIITQSINTGDTHSKEISIEQQNSILLSDDPWMQRKINS